MTTTAHLTAIKARCVALLEQAKRRTQGKWSARKNYLDRKERDKYAKFEAFPHTDGLSKPSDGFGEWAALAECESYDGENKANATFIASCAGPAEAGWASTIAAIEALESAPIYLMPDYLESQPTVQKLIAAWPPELL